MKKNHIIMMKKQKIFNNQQTFIPNRAHLGKIRLKNEIISCPAS